LTVTRIHEEITMKMRSLVAVIGACFGLILAAPACVPGEGADATSEEAAHVEFDTVTVSADTIAKLAPGELLTVDMSDASIVTRFEPRAGAIDFSRIELICPNGQTMRMDAWLEHQAQNGFDVETAKKTGFALGGNDQVASSYVSQVESSNEPTYDTQDVAICFCDVYSCSDGLVVIICDCYVFVEQQN
jgi:hypothetical protein